jgi:hypothetical protein
MSTNDTAATKSPRHDPRPSAGTQGTNIAEESVEKLAEAGEASFTSGAEILGVSAKAAQKTIEQFASLFDLNGDGAKAQDAVHSVTKNLDAVMQCNAALANGTKEVVRLWAPAVQTGMVQAMENFQRLLSCRSVGEVAAVRSEIMRTSMEKIMQCNVNMAEELVHITREAAQRCSLDR